MSLEVFFRKLDAYCKALYGDDDSGDFLDDLVIFIFDAPVLGDKNVKDCRSKNDAIEDGKRRL
jgi:hypothetical protein